MVARFHNCITHGKYNIGIEQTIVFTIWNKYIEPETVSNNLPSPWRVAARSNNSIKDGKYNVGTEQIIVLTV